VGSETGLGRRRHLGEVSGSKALRDEFANKLRVVLG
jgi:hypothetical protein